MAVLKFKLKHRKTGNLTEETMKISRNPLSFFKVVKLLQAYAPTHVIVDYECDEPEIKEGLDRVLRGVDGVLRGVDKG